MKQLFSLLLTLLISLGVSAVEVSNSLDGGKTVPVSIDIGSDVLDVEAPAVDILELSESVSSELNELEDPLSFFYRPLFVEVKNRQANTNDKQVAPTNQWHYHLFVYTRQPIPIYNYTYANCHFEIHRLSRSC